MVAAVSILGDSEFANRAVSSLIAPPTAVPGVGQEAYVIQPGPGVIEVWVHDANGYFTHRPRRESVRSTASRVLRFMG